MWEAVGALAGVLSAVVALLGYINTTRKIARDVEVLKEFENIPGRGESRHRDLKSSDLAMKIMMEIVKYDARLTILIWITIVFLLNVLMFVVFYGPILSYRRDSEYSLSMFLSANIIIWPYAIVGMIVIKMLMTSVRRSICSLIGYPVGLIYVKNFVDFYHPWDESLSKDIGKLLQ